MLLLDGCPSHKTPLMRKVYANAGYNVIISAPASYLSIPVERLFGLLKKQDFDECATPNLPVVNSRRIKHLTNKQKVMIKVTQYLRSLSTKQIK